MARHRYQEFIRFLNKINRETAAGRKLDLVVDNYATHKHQRLGPDANFSPTSASWLNAVEGFFAKLTRQRLKRSVFKGIVDLQAAINRYLAETNDNPKPFTWTADLDAIIEKVRRGKQALKSIHSHVRRFQMQANGFVACMQAVVSGSSGQGRRHGRRNDG